MLCPGLNNETSLFLIIILTIRQLDRAENAVTAHTIQHGEDCREAAKLIEYLHPNLTVKTAVTGYRVVKTATSA